MEHRKFLLPGFAAVPPPRTPTTGRILPWDADRSIHGQEVYLPPNTVNPTAWSIGKLTAKIRINPDIEDNKLRTVNQGFYKLTDKNTLTRIMVPRKSIPMTRTKR